MPEPWERPVAVAAVLAVAGVNLRGVTRTARLTRVLVVVVLLALACAVLASLLTAGPDVRRLAALGALLALVAGIGRTTLAMARGADLSAWLAAVHPRHRVPHRAEAILAGVVAVLVLAVDLRGAIGFSSFGVLLYYAVANAAALTQTGRHRRFPRGLQILGVTGCVVLAATLPVPSVAAGLAVLALGVLLRVLRRRRVRSGPGPGPVDPQAGTGR